MSTIFESHQFSGRRNEPDLSMELSRKLRALGSARFLDAVWPADAVDAAAARQGIAALYRWIGRGAPARVVVADGPMEMRRLAAIESRGGADLNVPLYRMLLQRLRPEGPETQTRHLDGAMPRLELER